MRDVQPHLTLVTLMKRIVFSFVCLMAVLLLSPSITFAQERVAEEPEWGVALFDGNTFEGWGFRSDENRQAFRIQDGAIVGGTMEGRIPRTQYLVTIREFGDFTLRLQAKMIGGASANGGVQIRSFRTPLDSRNPHEMIGYQADMTSTHQYWGSLYEGGRRASWFVAEADQALMREIVRQGDWNDLEIVCRGDNIRIYVNGRLTVDYTETDPDIPRRGFIGLQVHDSGPHECWYRNIRILEH